MLSRIGLVPRVIREGFGLKAAISCHLGELGASFISSYHEIDEIVLVDIFHRSTDEALTSRRCQVR